jgi:acyl-CoA synthetase (AMP-forming)/AMP-acid ligase II
MSVAAAIVASPDATVTEEQVLETCRTYLAGYKKPTRIQFVDALPMTTSLKVSRQRVREALLQGELSDESSR